MRYVDDAHAFVFVRQAYTDYLRQLIREMITPVVQLRNARINQEVSSRQLPCPAPNIANTVGKTIESQLSFVIYVVKLQHKLSMARE